ncbi:MAG: hypothetical protein AVDCRST_MAG02-262, partial [uncultured Rubrobacteraceae bacterium]
APEGGLRDDGFCGGARRGGGRGRLDGRARPQRRGQVHRAAARRATQTHGPDGRAAARRGDNGTRPRKAQRGAGSRTRGGVRTETGATVRGPGQIRSSAARTRTAIRTGAATL